MATDLKARIRELLILANGNLRINDHPGLIADALAQGIGLDELNKWASEIYHTINWNLFEKIDEQLLSLLNQQEGVFKEQHARFIVEAVKAQLDEQQVTSYLVQKLLTLGLEPRDRIPLDWSSFVNPWMTEIAWRRLHETTVDWLNEKAVTLEKLGEISYRKPVETKQAIRRTYALPPLITIITRNSYRADEYADIIDEEPDIEKRYLKILYRLNPYLPFRFKGQEYKTIEALLNAACVSAGLFWQLAEIYKLEHVHIWVKQSSPADVVKLTSDRELNGFLGFLYAMNAAYPFYVEENKFDTPELLIAEIKRSITLWPYVAKMLDQGNIQVWFAGIEKTTWNSSIEKGIAEVNASPLYSTDEFWKASVQVLVNAVTGETPAIEASRDPINLVDIEAGLPFEEIIELKLTAGEFVKAGITVLHTAPKLVVTPGTIVFERPEINHKISVRIDPRELTRDKDYQPRIVIETLYQQIIVPLYIRVIYPTEAVMRQLGLYAAIALAGLGLLRLLGGSASSFTFELGWIMAALMIGTAYGTKLSIEKYKVNNRLYLVPACCAVLLVIIILIAITN